MSDERWLKFKYDINDIILERLEEASQRARFERIFYDGEERLGTLLGW